MNQMQGTFLAGLTKEINFEYLSFWLYHFSVDQKFAFFFSTPKSKWNLKY